MKSNVSKPSRAVAAAIIVLALTGHARSETSAGDAKHGAELFQVCGACHSLAPDRNMTGPSLAGIWERKAGTLQSFERYSPALKDSGVVWDAVTLDAWLTNPLAFLPKSRMPFRGIADPKARADIIAFLRAPGEEGDKMAQMPSQLTNLKTVDPGHLVQAIRYCHDSYHVTTADGAMTDFWERNLRLKTDSSEIGPSPGQPAILPGGMVGDRASVFFSSPEEIGTFIKHQC